jgi:signal transduction histidine kinase
MAKRRMPKIFSSIFFKLMIIILIAGLGINLTIIIFFGAFRHHIANNYRPHLARYIDYLVKDIGDPPNPERARQIAAQTNMVISFSSPGHSWSTSDVPFSLPTKRMHIWHRNDRVIAGSLHGAHVVHLKHGGGRLSFFLPRQPEAEKKIKVISICLLFFITVLMVGAYFAIRWVLKPLRWLKKGVDQVARGDLSHRVPLKRTDELRDLSASFNTMTERLQHLIKSKEQLLLDISHELRTPITRVKVALALMPASPEGVSIEEDLKEMEKKITDLLETARALNIKSSLHLSRVDLSELIHKTAALFEAEKPEIRIADMPDSAPIDLDTELIGRALKNVLDNAQKYSPDHAAPIEISTSTDEIETIISIQDSGAGIPEEDLSFIFEPFYRVDKARTPQQDGYGLGLSMAKNIIEAHGGHIHISSDPDKGTLVQIHLPRSADPAGKA